MTTDSINRLLERRDQDFDGEAHLTNEELEGLVAEITRLQAENARLREDGLTDEEKITDIDHQLIAVENAVLKTKADALAEAVNKLLDFNLGDVVGLAFIHSTEELEESLASVQAALTAYQKGGEDADG